MAIDADDLAASSVPQIYRWSPSKSLFDHSNTRNQGVYILFRIPS